MKTTAKTCVAIAFVAACGGSHVAQANHLLCCQQPTQPVFSTGPCTWDVCPSPTAANPNPGYVYLFADNAIGTATIGLNGGTTPTGQPWPLTGLCFSLGSNAPDTCWTVTTSPDVQLEATHPTDVYVPVGYPGAGYSYEACYPSTPATCSGRLLEGHVCCDPAQPIPDPMGAPQSFISLPTAMATSVAAPPVPAMPVPMTLGFGAALSGLGFAAMRKR